MDNYFHSECDNRRPISGRRARKSRWCVLFEAFLAASIGLQFCSNVVLANDATASANTTPAAVNTADPGERTATTEEAEPVDLTPAGIYLSAVKYIKDSYLNNKSLPENWVNEWSHKYLGKLNTGREAHNAIRSMLGSLNDKSCRLEPPTKWCHSTGLRVCITEEDKVPVIIELQPRARKSGLAVGDKIMSIDGVNVQNAALKEILGYLDGESGTSATIIFRRGSKTGTAKVSRLLGSAVTDIRLLAKNSVGYVKLSSLLPADSVQQLEASLDALYQAKGIVLDLRDNPGGATKNISSAACIFVSRGMVLVTLDCNKEETGLKAQGRARDDRPLVVIVNENTARGAEALALALQENHRAPIVGTKTSGNGVIISVVKLADGFELSFPFAEIVSPSLKLISDSGLIPDYIVESTPVVTAAVAVESNNGAHHVSKPVAKHVGGGATNAAINLRQTGKPAPKPNLPTTNSVPKERKDPQLAKALEVLQEKIKNAEINETQTSAPQSGQSASMSPNKAGNRAPEAETLPDATNQKPLQKPINR